MTTSNRYRKPRINAGITLMEAIVIIVAIVIIAALALPAVQSMREQSRQAKCQYRLTQVHLATAAYQIAQQHYPAGTINPASPVRSNNTGFHHNWISAILPELDLMSLYNQIDQSVSVYHPRNATVREQPLPAVRCPSAFGLVAETTSNYAGNQSSNETPIDEHNNGVFFLNTTLTPDQIDDGLEYTMFVAEKLTLGDEDLGWLSGTRATLRNAGHPLAASKVSEPLSDRRVNQSIDAPDLFVGGFNSAHPDGVYLLMGSGRVRFYTVDGDLQVFQQLANRHDAPAPNDPADNPTDNPIPADAEAGFN